MNNAQMLNSNFFTLYIGIIVVAFGRSNLSTVDLSYVIFFLLLRIKIFLDDNGGFARPGRLTQPDFLVGYFLSLFGWIALCVGAYFMGNGLNDLLEVKLSYIVFFGASILWICLEWYGMKKLKKTSDDFRKKIAWMVLNVIYSALFFASIEVPDYETVSQLIIIGVLFLVLTIDIFGISKTHKELEKSSPENIPIDNQAILSKLNDIETLINGKQEK